MIRLIAALAAVAVLAGCGADGDPVPPGLTVGGSAQIGLTATL